MMLRAECWIAFGVIADVLGVGLLVVEDTLEADCLVEVEAKARVDCPHVVVRCTLPPVSVSVELLVVSVIADECLTADVKPDLLRELERTAC